MSSRPPIAFFAFNRPEHAKRALSALARCSGASDSELFVFVDGPRSPGEAQLCAQVAAIAGVCSGFKSVSVIPSDVNKGLYRSITEGVNSVLEHSGSIIVVEDDLVVSEAFLDYMAGALDRYADDPIVGSIHAYAFPIAGLPDFYFLRGGDCWGWATWRESWKLFRGEALDMLVELEERKLLDEFMMTHGAASLSMLCDRASNRNQSWAILWHASLFLAGRLTLHPGQTLVTNIGNDGSGTHSGITDRFSSSACSSWRPVLHLIPVIHDERAATLTSAFMDGFGRHRRMAMIFIRFKRFQSAQLARKVLRQSTTGSGHLGMIRSIARMLIPAQLRRSLNRLLGFGMRFSGPYDSWEQALRETSGYDSAEILARVSRTSAQVLCGEFAYEQDSIGFKTHSPPRQLLVALARAAAASPDRGLNVLDFGGSLGSLFHRVRPFIAPTAVARWVICEQIHFVESGNRHFRKDQLEFATDPIAVMGGARVDLLILSGVLPYLKDPLQTLSDLITLAPRWILVDRTPLSPDESAHLLVQHTPRSIYKASYPIWLLPASLIASPLVGQYALEETFDVAEGPVLCGSLTGHYCGMLWRRTSDDGGERG